MTQQETSKLVFQKNYISQIQLSRTKYTHTHTQFRCFNWILFAVVFCVALKNPNRDSHNAYNTGRHSSHRKCFAIKCFIKNFLKFSEIDFPDIDH